jgi:hypothetical protein
MSWTSGPPPQPGQPQSARAQYSQPQYPQPQPGQPQYPQSQPPAPGSGRRRISIKVKLTGLLVFVVLAGIGIYAAVHQGVSSINFKQGTISFQPLHPSSIKNNQSALQSELSQARANAQAQAAPAPSVLNIAGYWHSSSGYTYDIEQYGANVVIQEETPYGITAVGEGQVSGSEADFDYRAYDGSTGEAIFAIESSTTIDATFENYSYGTTSQAILTR